MESQDLNYQGIDPKVLEKKVKVSNLRFINESYTYILDKIRSKLLREILRKALKENPGSESIKSNDNFKAFFIKCSLYVFSGMTIDAFHEKPKVPDAEPITTAQTEN